MQEREHTDDPTSQDVARLKAAYAKRQAAQRPMSHSVAVAYQQLIAAKEQVKQPAKRK